MKESRYIEAVGRRKTATARVRITEAKDESFVVNDKALTEYFDVQGHSTVARKPLTVLGLSQKFAITVKIQGSGRSAQADALSLGLARAIVKWDEELKKKLKTEDLLKRDPRAVERKKPGLKKARKAPTWSKR